METHPELRDLQQRIRALSNNPNVSEEVRTSALQAEATALVAEYLANISTMLNLSFDMNAIRVRDTGRQQKP